MADYQKCVICLAPHTSNWDFVIAKLFYGAIGRHSEFLMKREWFFWPLGYVLRLMGGIPVSRGKRGAMVQSIAQRARESVSFHLAITPEATRKANANWKQGFYYIALEAKLPVVLYAMDYSRKTVYGIHAFNPTGNVEREMNLLKRYYETFKEGARHPEQFAI